MCEHRRMTSDLLAAFSDSLADAVAAAAPSVVQVQGGRRPASGLVYADNVVITTVRTLGREDNLHVRRDDGATLDAELAGWDPTTSLAVLQHGSLKRGYIGVSAQTVSLPEGQRVGDRDSALLAVGVTAGGPAAAGGLLVGDIITELDGQPVVSAEDLFDLLSGDRVGRRI